MTMSYYIEPLDMICESAFRNHRTPNIQNWVGKYFFSMEKLSPCPGLMDIVNLFDIEYRRLLELEFLHLDPFSSLLPCCFLFFFTLHAKTPRDIAWSARKMCYFQSVLHAICPFRQGSRKLNHVREKAKRTEWENLSFDTFLLLITY